MKRLALFVAAAALALYILLVGVLYFIQERLIFFPQKLGEGHRFTFGGRFEELRFKVDDDVRLHGLLFRADEPVRGLIFYLHGNAGSMEGWGGVAGLYTDLGYDLLMLDYRGFGKSEGRISSEAQLHRDVRLVYDQMKSRYREEDIVILGYSIGTGPATRLAAESKAGMLILQSPYYNLASIMAGIYPAIPRFILRYKLENNKYLGACKMPVVMFHGDRDEVIPYTSSLRLKALLKPADTLITLNGQAHNGMTENPDYRRAIRSILANDGNALKERPRD